MYPRLSAAFVALPWLLMSLPAVAQFQGIFSPPPVGPGDARPQFDAAAISRPAAFGADDRLRTVLPFVDDANRNGFFPSTGIGVGVGYPLVGTARTRFGLHVTPRLGRRDGQSGNLAGTGDLGAGVEAGVYWTQSLSRNWTVGLNLRGGDRGTEFDFGARRDFLLAPATRMSLFGFGTIGNDRLRHTGYGIDAGQAPASGYGAFEGGTGLRSARLGATVNHFFGGRWIAVGGVGIGHALGDAADSPILRQRTSVTGFAAIGYQLF